ncbi:hypothetical protein [Saccharothrix texasensis]|uniref:Site-specific recombinase XerD n=1 Tax=Saccharothrix texasensis TaxID=103734 RepID=A0A3N1H500_9PSEU|nr:hypothetical protein [Saccharothrix texasensis]ROP37292.1 hypothetical protein EDD40_2596 [Saccharothrix texasensis]
MSDRPYATAEQYERWFKRDCARCGRHGHFAAHWPDGHVCRTCHDRALGVRGQCPCCGQNRALPGLGDDDVPVCADCAGFRRSYACSRCGTEGKLHRRRLCTRCTLADQLHQALDDGTGRVHLPLVPLLDAIVATPRPKNGLSWLRSQQVRQLLGDLATGRVALTHEALQELPNWRTVAHLRDLLMDCGVLSVVDKQVLHTQTWLHHRLAALADNPHQQLLRQFGLWHQIPRLRRRAQTRPLTDAARRSTGEQFTQAERFLSWLDGRDRPLTDCTQTDIDTWHAQAAEHHKRNLRQFLTWAINTRHMPKLALPILHVRAGQPISQTRRLALLRRLLTDDQLPARPRVAACLMLLYAQPASRIVRLTTDDVLCDGDQVLVRLGEPPSPVPEPVGDLLLHLAGHHHNPNDSGSRWLFPGTRAGQPLHARTLLPLIRQLGVPAQATRVAALRQLVLQAPAPVIADALGFHNKHVTRVWTDAGGAWKTYAPSDPGR